MTVLVVAEVFASHLKTNVKNAVAAAVKLGAAVHVVVVGTVEDATAFQEASKLNQVEKIYTVKLEGFAQSMPEVVSSAVLALQAKENYSHILFLSTTAGKAAMPRVAAQLNVPALSDVVAIENTTTFKRYIYAGSLLATVKCEATPVIFTVRPTAFEAVNEDNAAVPVEDFTVSVEERSFHFESLEVQKSDRPDLLTAKRVVSGGRGLIDEAGFEKMVVFADKIGAAVGSTRALVDAEIAPAETQVGQTGKIVAPELYFAFGISGAIQHIAGMKDSKVVVAVNNDPEAPIFDVADFALVADAGSVLEELTAKL